MIANISSTILSTRLYFITWWWYFLLDIINQSIFLLHPIGFLHYHKSLAPFLVCTLQYEIERIPKPKNNGWLGWFDWLVLTSLSSRWLEKRKFGKRNSASVRVLRVVDNNDERQLTNKFGDNSCLQRSSRTDAARFNCSTQELSGIAVLQKALQPITCK